MRLCIGASCCTSFSHFYCTSCVKTFLLTCLPVFLSRNVVLFLAVCLGASGDIGKCLELAQGTPKLSRKSGHQLERFLLRRAQQMVEDQCLLDQDYCLLLAYELLYLWNALGACLKHSHTAIQIGKCTCLSINHLKLIPWDNATFLSCSNWMHFFRAQNTDFAIFTLTIVFMQIQAKCGISWFFAPLCTKANYSVICMHNALMYYHWLLMITFF